MFISKHLSLSTQIRISRQAKRPWAYFLKKWIDRAKKLNNFCSVYCNKMFLDKKLWIKMYKYVVKIFSSIYEPRPASAPFEKQNWNLNH